MELEYRLIKELWAFSVNRIAVRYAYDYHDDSGNWFRAYGNENWEFTPEGLMHRRFASINEMPIRKEDRKFHWSLGRRPDDHPTLSDLGLQPHSKKARDCARAFRFDPLETALRRSPICWDYS